MGRPAGADGGHGAHPVAAGDLVEDEGLASHQDLEGGGLPSGRGQGHKLGPARLAELGTSEGERPQGQDLRAQPVALVRALHHALALERGEQAVGGGLVEAHRLREIQEAAPGPLGGEGLEQAHRPKGRLGAGVWFHNVNTRSRW